MKIESIKTNDPATGISNDKARKVAQDFEAFFVNHLLNEMDKNINSNGFGINSTGTKIFKSMYMEKISDTIASKSDFGIEKLIYEKIKGKDNNDLSNAQKSIKDNINSSVKLNSLFSSYSGKSSENIKQNFEDIYISSPKAIKAREIISSKNSIYSSENKMDFINKIADEASQKYGIDKSLILAIIKTESNFDHKAKSPVGAKGLMQLMDPTAKELGVKNVWSIRENIMGGTKYYSQLEKSLGDKKLALAAYNAGIGNVRKYGGVPPFKETQNYIGKVIAIEKEYK